MRPLEARAGQQSEPTPDAAELRPRSPSLLVLTDHRHVAQRVRRVAAELARILVSRTMLEMGVLVATENKDPLCGH